MISKRYAADVNIPQKFNIATRTHTFYQSVLAVQEEKNGELIKSQSLKTGLESNTECLNKADGKERKEKTCLPFLPFWVEGDSLAAV